MFSYNSFTTKKLSNEEDDAKMVGGPTRLILKSFVAKLKKARDDGAGNEVTSQEELCLETIATIECNLKA